jgi:predicted membrane metal-binding protein
MLYNLGKTIAAGAPVETSVTVVEKESDSAPDVAWSAILFSRPILIAGLGLLAIAAFFLIDSVKIWIPVVTLLAGLLVAMWISYAMKRDQEGQLNVHRTLEGRSLIFTALVLCGGPDWWRRRDSADDCDRPRGAAERSHSAAVSTAGAARSGHLCSRRLLCLSQPDGAAVPQ